MGFLEYVSAILMPFFHNPIFVYILVLIILGVDATGTMFAQPQLNNFTLSGTDELSAYCASQHKGILSDWFYSIPFFEANNACHTIKNETNPEPLGIFGGLLTAIFHTAGLPNEVNITSPQLFLLMLFIPIVLWIATNHLGKR